MKYRLACSMALCCWAAFHAQAADWSLSLRSSEGLLEIDLAAGGGFVARFDK